MTPELEILTGDDGIRLLGRAWGGVGRPCLLLHGFGHTAEVWDDLAPELLDVVRPLALDARGHGRSEWDPWARYDPSDHAADLAAIVETLGESIVLIGHSQGGEAALRYAAERPGRVEALVLVDVGPGLALDSVQRIGDDTRRGARCYADPDEYAGFLRTCYPLASGSEAIDRLARAGVLRRRDGRYERAIDPALLHLGEDPGDLIDRFRDRDAELWALLAAIRCRTLVVRGGQSSVLKQDTAERMVRDALRDAELIVIEAAGHAVMLDAPQEFVEHVSGFVRATRAAA